MYIRIHMIYIIFIYVPNNQPSEVGRGSGTCPLVFIWFLRCSANFDGFGPFIRAPVFRPSPLSLFRYNYESKRCGYTYNIHTYTHTSWTISFRVVNPYSSSFGLLGYKPVSKQRFTVFTALFLLGCKQVRVSKWRSTVCQEKKNIGISW